MRKNTCKKTRSTSDRVREEESESRVSLRSEESVEAEKEWPNCWTVEQKNDFCTKYEWLNICNKKLGCTPCHMVRSLGLEKEAGSKVAKEWANNEITYYGGSRQQQLTSLRKKLFEHKGTAGHIAAVSWIQELASKSALPLTMLNSFPLIQQVVKTELEPLHISEQRTEHSMESRVMIDEDGPEVDPRMELIDGRLQDICGKLDLLIDGIGRLVKTTEANGTELRKLREMVRKRSFPVDDDDEFCSVAKKNHQKIK